MGRGRLVGWVLVLIGLAANAAIGLRHRAAAESTSAPAPGAAPETVTAAPPAPAGSSPPPAGSPGSSGALGQCQSRLAAAERTALTRASELREVLPPNRLFRLGSENPLAASSFGPIIDRLLATDAGPTPTHRVECRDEVCKLALLVPADGDPNTWMQALQRPGELRERVTGMSFHVGNPTQDPLTKEGLVEYSAYFRLGRVNQSPDAGAR